MPSSPVSWPLILIGLATATAAIAALSLRNLVHCALMFMISLAGVAAVYLHLGAQFVGFAQFLIYIGAVAILILFALLLTRGIEEPREPVLSSKWLLGLMIAAMLFATLTGAVLKSRLAALRAPPAPAATVQQVGNQLMTNYVLPLQIVGLVLTVALIGAVLIAMRDKEDKVP